MMILKFILKNLLIVLVIGFAINMLIKHNIDNIANTVTPQTLQLGALANGGR